MRDRLREELIGLVRVNASWSWFFVAGVQTQGFLQIVSLC